MARTPDLVGLEEVMTLLIHEYRKLTPEQKREKRRNMRNVLRKAGVRETTILGPRDYRYRWDHIRNYCKDKDKELAA